MALRRQAYDITGGGDPNVFSSVLRKSREWPRRTVGVQPPNLHGLATDKQTNKQNQLPQEPQSLQSQQSVGSILFQKYSLFNVRCDIRKGSVVGSVAYLFSHKSVQNEKRLERFQIRCPEHVVERRPLCVESFPAVASVKCVAALQPDNVGGREQHRPLCFVQQRTVRRLRCLDCLPVCQRSINYNSVHAGSSAIHHLGASPYPLTVKSQSHCN